MRGSWFQLLFGFSEGSRNEVLASLVYAKDLLMSKANNKSWAVGRFETPSLKELRERVAKLPKTKSNKRLKFVHSFGDVQNFLAHPENQFATFQVASQFNCLEFVGPGVTPEDGITGYAGDRTQGPACSIACGPATAVRNYLIPVTYIKHDGTVVTQIGQTEQRQVENLSEFNKAIGNEPGRYFKVRNGYTLGTDEGLEDLNSHLGRLTSAQLDEIRAALKVGVHSDVQVTATGWGRDLLESESPQVVSQVFSSACSVAYSRNHRDLWAPVATLILEATYEATLLSAILNAHEHTHEKGSRKVYLTAVGGGVFGNSIGWISKAIERACTQYFHHDLEVHLITYSRSQLDPRLEKLSSYFTGAAAGTVHEDQERKQSASTFQVESTTCSSSSSSSFSSASFVSSPSSIATSASSASSADLSSAAQLGSLVSGPDSVTAVFSELNLKDARL